MKLLRTTILAYLAALAIAIIPHTDARAEWGASIEAASCNPAADVAEDSNKNQPEWKSCISRKKRTNDFEVLVRFQPSEEFLWKFVRDNQITLIPVYWAVYNTAYQLAFHSTFDSTMAACEGTCAPAATAAGVVSGRYAGLAAIVTAIGTSIGAMVLTEQNMEQPPPSYNAEVDADRLDATHNDNKFVSRWIKVGDTKPIIDLATGLAPMATAEVRLEGDKACVYMKEGLLYLYGFKADRSESFNKHYNVDPSSTSLPSHCVYLPPPEKVAAPPRPAFISKSCVDYNSNGSQFMWPKSAILGDKPTSRSVLGVIVQCVEETMGNLFFASHGSKDESVFVKLQDQLKSYVRVLLILYIIVLGYKYGLIERTGVKQSEFIWIGLRIALVLYFATGNAMTQLLPGIIGGIKDMSAIIIDATAGDPQDKAKAREDLRQAQQAYEMAKTDHEEARKNWYIAPEDQKTTMQETATAKQGLVQQAEDTLEKAKIKTLSFGYDYCDFRPFVDAGKYNINVTLDQDTILYEDTKIASSTTSIGSSPASYDANSVIPAGTTVPAGTTIVKNMSYMHLWDSIDCRLAKYLGIGANPQTPSAPQFMLLGIASILMGPVGIMVFLLSMTFLIFIVLVVIRIVHIYLIAFVALILLAYISPLVFPMVFFDNMRESFNAWLKQFMAYIIQPIILFAALAFMFAIFDNIIWGNNYDFYPKNKEEMVTRNLVGYASERLYDNTAQMIHTDHNVGEVCDPRKVHKSSGQICNGTGADCVINPANYDCRCQDENSIGCMYQKFRINVSPIEIAGAKIMDIYHVYGGTSSFNEEDTSYGSPQVQDPQTALEEAAKKRATASQGEISHNQLVTYMIGLMKLVFACFIMHAVLGQIENMSRFLTNVAASATEMSAAPVANPHAIGSGVLSASSGAAKLGGKVSRKALSIATLGGSEKAATKVKNAIYKRGKGQQ